MKILHGLLAGQVLQRNARNRASALVTGTGRTRGTVEVRVTQGRRVLRGLDWSAAGECDGREFCATVGNIPTGGPYTVEFRIRAGAKAADAAQVDGIFAGDVWFMGGQSNMQGCGNRVDAPAPHPMVRAFYMRDEWDIAEEPMHFLAEAVDSFHNGYGDGPSRPPRTDLDRQRKGYQKGVSPGHAFALDLYRRTKVPQGLVACAHGGTSMRQWSPELRGQGGASLYGAMMRRFEKLGQPIAGVIWYQGESDASEVDAPLYTQRMQELVAATRRDMGLPKLPWLIVQIGCHVCAPDIWWNSIQDQERKLPEVIDHLDVAPSIDLELDDGIHISGRGQAILGRRLARLAARLVYHDRTAKPSIAFESISASVRSPRPGVPPCTVIDVKYANVAGALQSAGRPNGFVLQNPDGAVLDAIYKTSCEESTVVLESGHPLAAIHNARLSYGFGRYSYCNIVDAEGMGLPVMYQIPLARENMLPFVLDWTAAPCAAAKSVTGISYAKARALRGWKPAATEQGWIALPRPLSEKRLGVFVFKTTVVAVEDMNAELHFGADSPFILWVNGREAMRDPKATNPVLPSEYRKSVAFKKGKNEILVAFDTRNGQGWGIALTFMPKNKKCNLKSLLSYS